MSSRSYAAPALGASAFLGGMIYFARKPPATSGDAAQQIPNENKPRPTSDEVVSNRKQQADAKRDLGLGGAGVGMNQTTGGTELGSGLKSGNTQNPNRDSPKGPTDKMPSDAGEIGGGQGRGKANTRAIETHGPLQGFFGTGGNKDGERPKQAPVDTKIPSNHADTYTKRGGSPFDKHTKDVTATSNTSERPGQEQ
ncbi:hypothetical protein CCHL11_00206 [Colletotrichum chlorophyti]|uniref:Uncharacterized protein n=1 Tax=Colletotrichum chlorophyti TaxID=708187 RepID=A0A1Q8RVD1_9PEZI|nr:hypothetical protein CCHL11_00206 [Colletotrichum chlorophyti]